MLSLDYFQGFNLKQNKSKKKKKKKKPKKKKKKKNRTNKKHLLPIFCRPKDVFIVNIIDDVYD